MNDESYLICAFVFHAHPLADGLTAFHSFLRSEFSEENIEFWMACEDLKKTKSPMKKAAKSKKIYENFIQPEAPQEVCAQGKSRVPRSAEAPGRGAMLLAVMQYTYSVMR